YLALVREARPAAAATWRGWYEFFPWEDWRAGRPEVLDSTIAPELERWVASAPDRLASAARRARGDRGFGLHGAPGTPERVLDRYELLFEVGLVDEAWRHGVGGAVAAGPGEVPRAVADPGVRLGVALALDHRRILASSLGRLRGKLRYRPVVFELLPRT